MAKISSAKPLQKNDPRLPRYAMAVEDVDLCLDALNIQSEDSCLSVGMSGDVAFAMLLRSPRHVTLLQPDAKQYALSVVKKAAIQALEWKDYLDFLGVIASASVNRTALLMRVTAEITDPIAKEFLSNFKNNIVASGLAHVGRIEEKFGRFRAFLSKYILPPNTLETTFEPRSYVERRAFYEQRWSNWKFHLMMRVMLSKEFLAGESDVPEFKQFVKNNVVDDTISAFADRMVNKGMDENAYLSWILLGSFKNTLPIFLKETEYNTIRSQLQKIEIVHQPVANFFAQLSDRNFKFDRLYMGNIFELAKMEVLENVLQNLLSGMKTGGRVIHWGFIVPRIVPPRIANKFKYIEEITDIFQKDTKSFYIRQLSGFDVL